MHIANQHRIVLGQLDFLVGDVRGNTQKILQAIEKTRDELQGQILIFPELALSGYPPDDLLLRPEFHTRIQIALHTIAAQTQDITVILGYPHATSEGLYNAAAVFQNGQLIANYYKQKLPNYGVFDEKRYFTAGSVPCVISVKGISVGILICEDLWYSEPLHDAIEAGAQIIVCPNASPFHREKHHDRINILQKRIAEYPVPIFYVNNIGTQDDFIFDGDSMVVDAQGRIVAQAACFEEQLLPVDLMLKGSSIHFLKLALENEYLTPLALTYKALVLGVRDYWHKNRFSSVLLGLSGGIDSALTLAIAVDALGKNQVHAVMLPSRYTSGLSIELAELQAKAMGVKYSTINIEPVFQGFLDSLAGEFVGTHPDVTEENLQARVRGTLLMALSNKTGALVLTTSNKSELSMGYSTLYGDMSGSFAALKDVWKTLVFELAHYRNSISPIIPEAVINRAPTAELTYNQKDEDSLPPYPILDAILQAYVEQNKSIEEIIAEGFDPTTVKRVVTLLLRNEYKRRQSPPGIKITRCAFGRDRRYPITSGFQG